MYSNNIYMAPKKKARSRSVSFSGSRGRSKSKGEGSKRGRPKGAKNKVKTIPYENVTVQGKGGQISWTITKSSKTLLNKKSSDMLKQSMANYYFNNSSGRLEAGVGLQNTKILPMGSQIDMIRIYEQILQLIGYGGLGVATQGATTSKWWMDNMKGELAITNQDSGNVQIIIYDVIAYKDNFLDAQTCWSRGINEQSIGTLGTGGLSASTVGTYPQQSKLFTNNYKVVKKTRVILGGGESHTHKVKYTPRKFFSATSLTDETTLAATEVYKALTYQTMVTINGMPYNDTITKTQVSTGTATIDFVFTKNLTFKYLADNLTTMTGINALPVGFTTGESELNVATGAVITGTKA